MDVAQGTGFNVKRRFAEDGLDGLLKDRPQAHRYRKMNKQAEARLIALAWSAAEPTPSESCGREVVIKTRPGTNPTRTAPRCAPASKREGILVGRR